MSSLIDEQEIQIAPLIMKEAKLLNPKFSRTSIGLQNNQAIIFLLLWYAFSASTLFLNKYILSYQGVDPVFLCATQMFITMCCGLFQMHYPLGTYQAKKHDQKKPEEFARYMVIVGGLQLGTIMFGLMAIFFVAVSFAETVKSSAPIFTVIIARMLLGEMTGNFVLLSLIPIMLGLALCSSNELSFSLVGFLCAMTTNLCECLQSVFSKHLLSDSLYKYSPAELQFYPNLAAVLFQLPVWIFFKDLSPIYALNRGHFITILLGGISFHGQTITAYVLMSYISPVTYSVANTTKRAVLIWFSVLLFGNPITILSGLGTITVILGVLLYSQARQLDAKRRMQFSIENQLFSDIS